MNGPQLQRIIKHKDSTPSKSHSRNNKHNISKHKGSDQTTYDSIDTIGFKTKNKGGIISINTTINKTTVDTRSFDNNSLNNGPLNQQKEMKLMDENINPTEITL